MSHKQFILLENNPYRRNKDVSNQADVELKPNVSHCGVIILLFIVKLPKCWPAGRAECF